MVRQRIQTTRDFFRRVATQPRHELSRWQLALRYGYDLIVYGWKQLNETRAPMMAAALSFRTLFGLLPVLVVGTVLVRALMSPDQFKVFLAGGIDTLVAKLGLQQVLIYPPSEVGTEGLTLALWLRKLVDPITEINLAALGWVGLALLIYSAIGLMVTVENSFNVIYRAPEGRSWGRRVPVYWTCLTIAPAAIGLATFVDSRFNSFIESVGGYHWLLTTARLTWSFTLTWSVLFFIYWLVPNTTVAVRPAATGAIISALLIEIGKRTMGAYLEHAISFRQLYGALGLIPLFMFWVYVMWMVILFGLEVSAAVQMLKGRPVQDIEPSKPQRGIVDPASVLTVMRVVAQRFERALPTSARQVADSTGLAESVVAQMFQQLIEARFLHRVEHEETCVTLARPPAQIVAGELIDLGFRMVDEGISGARPPLVERLREAQRSLTARITLAGLDGPDGPIPAGSQARLK
jgi:membrane protein